MISGLRQLKGGIEKLFEQNTKNFLKGNVNTCMLMNVI